MKKLKSKHTGVIGELLITDKHYAVNYGDDVSHTAIAIYTSLDNLNEDWEDYEEPKEYYCIDWTEPDGIYKTKREDVRDDFNKEIGNYFNTREEAEKAVEKLKAWKRLKDNGFKIKGWKFTPDMKQIEGNYVKIEAEVPQILINEKDIDLLFGGEE